MAVVISSFRVPNLVRRRVGISLQTQMTAIILSTQKHISPMWLCTIHSIVNRA